MTPPHREAPTLSVDVKALVDDLWERIEAFGDACESRSGQRVQAARHAISEAMRPFYLAAVRADERSTSPTGEAADKDSARIVEAIRRGDREPIHEADLGTILRLESENAKAVHALEVVADEITALRSSLTEAEQQLDVLRPGGLYAWKFKYEELVASQAAQRREDFEAIPRYEPVLDERGEVVFQLADAGEWIQWSHLSDFREQVLREIDEDFAAQGLDEIGPVRQTLLRHKPLTSKSPRSQG